MLAAALAACTATSGPTSGPSSERPGGPTSSGGGRISGQDGGGGNGADDPVKPVYLLSSEGELYALNPAQRKSAKIGPVDCGPELVPESIAVDCDGAVWVNARKGVHPDDSYSLFKLDTKSGSCTPADLTLPPPDRKSDFPSYIGSMSFGLEIDRASGTTTNVEGLFVESAFNAYGCSLGRADFGAKTLRELSATGSYCSGQLATTNNGSLYVLKGHALTKLDQRTPTHALPTKLLDTLPQSDVSSEAVAFWGGDFYIFTATPTSTSTVSRYRLTDDTLESPYMDAIGFKAISAGASWCTPHAP